MGAWKQSSKAKLAGDRCLNTNGWFCQMTTPQRRLSSLSTKQRFHKAANCTLQTHNNPSLCAYHTCLRGCPCCQQQAQHTQAQAQLARDCKASWPAYDACCKGLIQTSAVVLLQAQTRGPGTAALKEKHNKGGHAAALQLSWLHMRTPQQHAHNTKPPFSTQCGQLQACGVPPLRTHSPLGTNTLTTATFQHIQHTHTHTSHQLSIAPSTAITNHCGQTSH